MVDRLPLAVLLRLQLRGHPLARVNANSGAHRVRLVVRDVDDVLGVGVGLIIARAGVWVRKLSSCDSHRRTVSFAGIPSSLVIFRSDSPSEMRSQMAAASSAVKRLGRPTGFYAPVSDQGNRRTLVDQPAVLAFDSADGGLGAVELHRETLSSPSRQRRRRSRTIASCSGVRRFPVIESLRSPAGLPRASAPRTPAAPCAGSRQSSRSAWRGPCGACARLPA